MSYRGGGRPPYGGTYYNNRSYGVRNEEHPPYSESRTPSSTPGDHNNSYNLNHNQRYPNGPSRGYYETTSAKEPSYLPKVGGKRPLYPASQTPVHSYYMGAKSRSTSYEAKTTNQTPKPFSEETGEASSIDQRKSKVIVKHYDISRFLRQNHELSRLSALDYKQKENQKSFKITYDPELHKDPSKGSKPIYQLFDPKTLDASKHPLDPRSPSHPHHDRYMKRLTRKPYTSLPIPRYKYDRHSVGPKPSNQIVIWNFPSTTSLVLIRNNFTQFGKISELHGVDDPNTAVPLGLCILTFDGDIEQSHDSARKAVEQAHKKLQVNGSAVQCGLNIENKLYNTVYNRILQTRQLKLKAVEAEQQRERARQQSNSLPKGPRTQRTDVEKQLPPTSKAPPKPLQPAIGSQDKRSAYAGPGNLSALSDIISGQTASQEPEPPAVKLSSHDRHIKVTSNVALPPNFERHIDKRSFILIPDKYVSTRDVSSSDIRKLLSKYNCDRILTHKTGFYVVFNDLKDGERCFDQEDGRRFLTYKMFMEFVVPDEMIGETRVGEKIGVVGQAKSILVKEFHNYLLKDLREKVIGTRLLKMLDSDKYTDTMNKYLEEKQELQKKQKERENVLKLEQQQQQNQQRLLIGLNPVQVTHQSSSIKSLTSFRRKPSSTAKRPETIGLERSKPLKKKPGYKSKLNIVPMAHALNFSDNDGSSEDEEDEEEDDEDNESEGESESPVEEDENSMVVPPPSKQKRKIVETTKSVKKQKTTVTPVDSVDSVSSEEDEESKANTISEPTSPEAVSKKDGMEIDKEHNDQAHIDENEYAGVEDGKEHDVPTDFSQIDIIYRPSRGIPTPVYEDDFKSMELDLDNLQDILKDEEDLELAKKAFASLSTSDSIKDILYWSWKQKNTKTNTEQLLEERKQIQEDVDEFDFEEDIVNNETLQNSTGSFRTQGYYKIPDKLKNEYLLHRRKANKPLNTVQNEDDNEAQTNNIFSSRVNRANNRRFAADISAQKQTLGSQTDILDLNQLTKRKKPVQFARSAIHNWGLYALEPIAAKEMIIEYVGDRIRQQVAEVREKKYLRSGIGSSYLFRIDENTVIDASKKGGIARFINHCCVPSCTAKIIKVEGKKRIVIYALRDIAANEELTYDYKFERETNDDERIPCLCGAPGCKGYLN